jgi:hypothetical protein
VNKKKQKNFAPFEPGCCDASGSRSKSFLVLFFKKEHPFSEGIFKWLKF